MSQSKSLKVSLKRSEFNAAYGEDVELSVDLSTVKDVIVGAVDMFGAKKCLELGGAAAIAATSIYVIVKAMKRTWPWAKVTNVDGDTIEVTVPQDKKEELTNLLQKNALQKQLVSDFENIDDNLEGILGDEYKTYGSEIIEVLKDVRVDSIAPCNKSDRPEKMVARQIIRGKADVIDRDTVRVFAVGESSDGLRADTVVDSGGILKQNITGSTTIMTVGMKGKDHEATMKYAGDIAGSKITIRILGDALKETFEQRCKPDTTVFEVLRDMKKAQGIPVEKKVKLKRKRENGEEDLKDMQMLVKKLGKPGELVILWAEFEGSQ